MGHAMTPGDEYHRAQARLVWLLVILFVGCVAAASVGAAVLAILGR